MENQMTLFRAKHGSAGAFEQLVKPYEKMIWRVCFQIMGNTYDAEEAAQQSMVKAWKSIHSFREEASLSTWLYRIAVNCCNDEARRKNRQWYGSVEEIAERGEDVADANPGPEMELLRNEKNSQIRWALDQLNLDQRIPLILFAVEGKSYDEISEILEISLGTVKSRIARGRERLRTLLSRADIDGKEGNR